MPRWLHPRLDAMTPLMIYEIQHDHAVLIFRFSKTHLRAWRRVLKHAFTTPDKMTNIPVPTKLLRRQRRAWEELFRRLDGAGSTLSRGGNKKR